MAASATSCAHCGKQGVSFKRLSRCNNGSYCGAECQRADWKQHKKTCVPAGQLPEASGVMPVLFFLSRRVYGSAAIAQAQPFVDIFNKVAAAMKPLNPKPWTLNP
ncbi:hypothetical protein T484DRAFT_1625465 [Baffinella frigidus]|nr:hypothetical protein T484DRAFT_1625465 [Cryptophyta sp. CCMP2293]